MQNTTAQRAPRRAASRLVAAGLAVLAALLLFPRPSFGWGNTWLGDRLEQIIKAARLKLGPFRYNATLQLDTLYDSDIYFGSTANPIPDYSISIGPRLDFYLPVLKGLVLEIGEVPQYIYFFRTAKDRSLNNTFQSHVHLALNRWFFRASAGLINAKDRVSSEMNFNVRRAESNFSGLAFWQLSKAAGLTLQFRSVTERYENPPEGNIDYQQTLDRTENYVDLKQTFQTGLRTRFSLDAEYGTFAFAAAVSSFKDSRSLSLSAGIEFLPPQTEVDSAKSIEGNLNLGYRQFYLIRQAHSYYSPVGSAMISVAIPKFATLQARFARDIHFSAYTDITGYVETLLGAGISRALSRRVSVNYELLYSRNDYGIFETDGSRNLGLDTYLTHGFFLALRPAENLEIRILGNVGSRTMSLLDKTFRRSFFGVSLTYGYRGRESSAPAGQITPN
jgi:hypothetical protein